MLDQEKKNLENLKISNNANRNEVGQAETNILRLQEQLRQMHGEVSDRNRCPYTLTALVGRHIVTWQNKFIDYFILIFIFNEFLYGITS